jgi:hypothetical protein
MNLIKKNGGIEMKKLWAFFIFMAAAMPLMAAQQDSQQFHPAAKMAEQVNNGQDLTRPVTRVDVRYQFVNVPGGYHQDIYTLRSDAAIKPGGKWVIALRGDIPTVYGDVPASDNENGKLQFAIGDIVTQAAAGYLFSDKIALGAGFQFTWPTASNRQSGTGKCVVMPLLGFRVSLPEISNGSFFFPFLRYASSFAGTADRKNISKLEFAPCLNLMLPEKLFLVLWPDPEIQYDFEQKAWTIPANFMIGKMFAKNIVGSIECFIPMFEASDYQKNYNFKTEARMGFFF